MQYDKGFCAYNHGDIIYMKLITLIHSGSNIADSLNIKSFFELAGVCIYMINTDIKIDNSNENRVLALPDIIVCTVDRTYSTVCKLYDNCILYSSLPDLLDWFVKKIHCE